MTKIDKYIEMIKRGLISKEELFKLKIKRAISDKEYKEIISKL